MAAVAGYVGTYTLIAGQAFIGSMFVGTGTGGGGVMTVSGTGVLDVGGVLKVYKNGNKRLCVYMAERSILPRWTSEALRRYWTGPVAS